MSGARKLSNLTPVLDKRLIALKVSCMGDAGALRGMNTYRPANADGARPYEPWRNLAQREAGFQRQIKENYDDAHSKLLLALRKLSTDGSMIKELLSKK